MIYSQMTNDIMLIVEQARYGMVSIIAYQCCGCDEQISFAISTKTASPEGNKYWTSGPVMQQLYGDKWLQEEALIIQKSQGVFQAYL